MMFTERKIKEKRKEIIHLLMSKMEDRSNWIKSPGAYKNGSYDYMGDPPLTIVITEHNVLYIESPFDMSLSFFEFLKYKKHIKKFLSYDDINKFNFMYDYINGQYNVVIRTSSKEIYYDGTLMHIIQNFKDVYIEKSSSYKGFDLWFKDMKDALCVRLMINEEAEVENIKDKYKKKEIYKNGEEKHIRMLD